LAELVADVEDGTVAATAMVRRKREAQVLRVSRLGAKVRLEKEKKTMRDDLRVSVAEEAFTEEEVGTEAEADGAMDLARIMVLMAITDAEVPLLLHSVGLVVHLT
jgi:hypothetical protein